MSDRSSLLFGCLPVALAATWVVGFYADVDRIGLFFYFYDEKVDVLLRHWLRHRGSCVVQVLMMPSLDDGNNQSLSCFLILLARCRDQLWFDGACKNSNDPTARAITFDRRLAHKGVHFLLIVFFLFLHHDGAHKSILHQISQKILVLVETGAIAWFFSFWQSIVYSWKLGKEKVPNETRGGWKC